MKKKYLSLFVKLLLSGVAIAIVAIKIDLRSVLSLFPRADLLLLIIALLLAFVQIVINAVKIRTLLPGCGIGIGYIALTNCAANIFRFMVPTEIGAELGRAYYFNKKTGSAAASFSAIIIDRYTGIFAQVAIMTGVSFVTALRGGAPFWSRLALIGAVGVIALIAAPLLLSLLPPVKQSSRNGFRQVTGALAQLSGALSAYRKAPQRLGAAVGIALVYHCLVLVMIICTGKTFNVTLEFEQAALLTVVSSLGFFIPSLAGLGITEGVFAGIFGFFLHERETGVAVSLALRVVMAIVMVPGVVFFIANRNSSEPVRETEMDSSSRSVI
jgi:uncharacterized membrane protein YbhN (UPF0104 family)